MNPVELSRTVLHAVRCAVDGGELSVRVPERVVVGRPGRGGCGDYATNVALQLARPAGQPPLRVAGILRARLLDLGSEYAIEDVVVTPPGFLNIRLRDSAPAGLVAEILRCGARYGHATGDTGGPGERVLTLRAPDEVRALVVMDVAARLLRAQGADVRTVTDCDTAPPTEPHWIHLLGLENPERAVSPERVENPERLAGPAGGGPGAHRPPRPGDTPAPPATPTRFLRPVPAPADPTPLGRDAARWALLHPAAHDRPRLGDEHLVQRESNPLFRVRYAHARTRVLLRNAADLGFAPEPGRGTGPRPGSTEATGTAPVGLVALLVDHPRVLRAAATACAPDRLARHLVDVADAVLPFLPAVLPVGEEKPSAAHRARLALAEAAGTVLAGGLSLLGIDAPDHL